MTCCPTRTSARATTAARSTRTAIPRCRSAAGSAAIRPAPAARSRAAGQGFENFNFGGGEAADLSDLFEGLFGGAGGARRGGGGRSAASASARGRRRRAPTSPIGSRSPFDDAVALKPQRITLADGKTIDLKLPKGVEDGTKIRLAGKGRRARAAAATRSSRSRSRRIASSPATATTSASTCRSRSRRRCSAPRSRCRRPKGR